MLRKEIIVNLYTHGFRSTFSLWSEMLKYSWHWDDDDFCLQDALSFRLNIADPLLKVLFKKGRFIQFILLVAWHFRHF